jgi:hypothetical protein
MNNNWSIFGFLDINSLSSFEGTTLQLNIRLVTMAKRSHPFPCRTRKLSSSAPMVVGGSPPVRVGRRQAKYFLHNHFICEAAYSSIESITLSNIYIVAGWSSSVARRAHNPKVAGSNPVPAIPFLTKDSIILDESRMDSYFDCRQGNETYFAYANNESYFAYAKNFGPVVQLVRMPACHAGGRGFESRPDRQICLFKRNLCFVFFIAYYH